MLPSFDPTAAAIQGDCCAQRFTRVLEGFKAHTLFPADPFRVHSDRDGVWAVLTIFGELDLKTAQSFEAEVERVFSDGEQDTGLLVDIAGLTFTDSSGIRATISAALLVHGRFGLVRVPDKIQKLLSMKGLGIVLRSFPDLDTAKAALT
jgi:anti-sigma B factor antagonist